MSEWIVPLLDLVAQYQTIRGEIDGAISRVLAKGNFVSGAEVEAFEAEWAAHCGAKHAVALSSGTDALTLAYAYFAEENGLYRVVLPAMTFFATAEAAVRAGMDIKLVDVSADGVVDEASYERAHVDSKRDIWVPVNLYGRAAYVPASRTATVVEDAAQSHGIPMRGLVGCYSFYPSKNLGAMGQAGALVTNDKDLATWVRVAANHGETPGKRFVHGYKFGGNYRMDELQAAILRVKLPHLAAWNKRRREIEQVYSAGLIRLDVAGRLTLPAWHDEHVWHIYAVRTPERDKLAAFLKDRRIQTAVRYPLCLHKQPALEDRFRKERYPVAESIARETLSLPIYPEMDAMQVEYVAGQVRTFFSGGC